MRGLIVVRIMLRGVLIFMDIVKFNEIKEKALEDKVPIIMDETLERITEVIGERRLSDVLEIGTAVRVFCYLFF